MNSNEIEKLRIKDASFMLEWMHDESVVNEFKRKF